MNCIVYSIDSISIAHNILIYLDVLLLIIFGHLIDNPQGGHTLILPANGFISGIVCR